MGTIILILFLFLSGFMYFLPSLVAYSRKHKNREPILVVNLFLGWSILGWVVALAWACTAQEKS